MQRVNLRRNRLRALPSREPMTPPTPPPPPPTPPSNPRVAKLPLRSLSSSPDTLPKGAAGRRRHNNSSSVPLIFQFYRRPPSTASASSFRLALKQTAPFSPDPRTLCGTPFCAQEIAPRDVLFFGTKKRRG